MAIDKKILELQYNVNVLGKEHLYMDFNTFMDAYYIIYDELMALFFYDKISKDLKKYFKRKLMAIRYSYKYNNLYMNEYRYRKFFY